MSFFRITLLVLLFSSSFLEANEICNYSQANSCPIGYVCVKQTKDETSCQKDMPSKLKVPLPFAKNVDVICDQGNLSPDGNSHNFANTAYALDLAGLGSSKVDIVSATSGKVVAYD